jgi:hypothetical protein|tara:strand:+ start:266 stop:1201 length:936 start_codon:yes stop_codon:yes gene_type:complete
VYSLSEWVLGSTQELEISESRFQRIKEAKKLLSEGLAIEEKWEILVSNYVDLESDCLSATTSHMLFSEQPYEAFFKNTVLFNKRLVNLLTASRLYSEQIESHIGRCFPDSSQIKDEVKSWKSKAYDSMFEYRFMEALRNYAQHRGLAVHQITVGGSWTDVEREDAELRNGIKLFTHKSKVEDDSAFKKTVVKEMPEKVDLMLMVRVYISELSKIHLKARELLKDRLAEAREVISSSIDEYVELSNSSEDKKVLGLHAIHWDESVKPKKAIEKQSLLLEWDDMRVALTKKNGSLGNLKKWVVTSSLDYKKKF